VITSLPVPVIAQEASSATQGIEAFILSLLFLFLMGVIGRSMGRRGDEAWIQRYVVWGFVAKLFGAFARFWMVTVLYGAGDSYVYHDVGIDFANVWRSFAVPISTSGSPGTAFTQVVTGFIYSIYTPTFLGAFIIFATLSYFGQLLFFSAFRSWFGPRKRKLYALAVLFYPSLVFWPSSLGKDALMVFFLGVATYGASRLLKTYRLSSVLLIAPALYLAAGIRPHIAGILGIALVLAILLGKAPEDHKGSPKRALMLIVAVLGALAILATVASTFEVSVGGTGRTQDLAGFLSDVSEQTGTGGSEITGGAIGSWSQIPPAIITVLFRPLIYEGTGAQVLASALEGTALLLLVIWKLPIIWRNKGLLRRSSYLFMCFFYTGGFIIGFSAILNLGILARQRVQVLPFFLALVVALGWPEPDEEPPQAIAEPRPAGVTTHTVRSAVLGEEESGATQKDQSDD
jgi:hypothetical protein